MLFLLFVVIRFSVNSVHYIFRQECFFEQNAVIRKLPNNKSRNPAHLECRTNQYLLRNVSRPKTAFRIRYGSVLISRKRSIRCLVRCRSEPKASCHAARSLCYYTTIYQQFPSLEYLICGSTDLLPFDANFRGLLWAIKTSSTTPKKVSVCYDIRDDR